MPDDDFLLGQCIELLRGPGPLVGDAAGQFQFPGGAVDRLDVLDVEMGVEARRLDHLRGVKRRRQMIGPEDRRLHAVVPCRHRAQHLLHRLLFGHVAAGQQRQRAETDGAAQHAAPVDGLDQRPVLRQHALGRSASAAETAMASGCEDMVFTASGRCFGRGVGRRRLVVDGRAAGQHGDKALRHQQSQRHMDQQKATIADMQRK